MHNTWDDFDRPLPERKKEWSHVLKVAQYDNIVNNCLMLFPHQSREEVLCSMVVELAESRRELIENLAKSKKDNFTTVSIPVKRSIEKVMDCTKHGRVPAAFLPGGHLMCFKCYEEGLHECSKASMEAYIKEDQEDDGE